MAQCPADQAAAVEARGAAEGARQGRAAAGGGCECEAVVEDVGGGVDDLVCVMFGSYCMSSAASERIF